jgi:transcriptional regulator with XRE-family HTH domain
MARNYKDASAERRARLSPKARGRAEVFERAYGLAVQVMQRRLDLGWTQAQLADKADIDQGDLSRIERGVIAPNESTLARIADVMGCSWQLVEKPAAVAKVTPIERKRVSTTRVVHRSVAASSLASRTSTQIAAHSQKSGRTRPKAAKKSAR